MNFMKTIHASSLSRKARLLASIIRNGESTKFMVLIGHTHGMQNMRSLLHMAELIKYSVLDIYVHIVHTSVWVLLRMHINKCSSD